MALLAAALVGIVAVLGHLAEHFGGASFWAQLIPFAAVVLTIGIVSALTLRAWLAARAWLAQREARLPAVVAVAVGLTAISLASGPAFHRDVAQLKSLFGGMREAERMTIAHQVFAAYRRADLKQLQRLFERARSYEPTVHEAAQTFGVDAEVLMGVAAAESAFYPRNSADGGRGLFQITAPPKLAVEAARKHLGVERLDLVNHRHNAFVAAATLRRYLREMHGDPFLGLLAYNIGPQNGGLRTIMDRYGARDFVTIQPYLQHLPREYPIRVLTAALAYRLWKAGGRLPRYEESSAMRIQSVGIPGLQ